MVAPRQAAIPGEHLIGGEISKRNAHGFGGIEVAGDRHQKARRTDRILRVAANDTEIGDQLSGEACGHAGPGRLDDADKIVTRRERQRPFEVRVAAAADEGVGEAGAGGKHLDADLAGTGHRDGLIFRELQNLGTAEPCDTDGLPCHAEYPGSLRVSRSSRQSFALVREPV
jgi:hypothetical protein